LAAPAIIYMCLLSKKKTYTAVIVLFTTSILKNMTPLSSFLQIFFANW
jgi:hypothetical protein